MTFSLAMLIAASVLRAAEPSGDDWPSYGGTHAAWRFSTLRQIHSGNVARLAPAWMLQTGDAQNGLQATPIVVDGVIYLSTSSNWVLAIEGATGRVLWEYRFPLSRNVPVYTAQNRGVAVGHGMVFMGTADNHMVAINQKTGAEVWRVNVQDPRQCGCNITAAPLVVKDMVVTGVTGGDSAHRGYLTAFDAKTGRFRWRFYTIPAPGEKGNETWPGDSWRFGGGSTWMTGSFDAELNLLYWGVGNASSDVNGSKRRGDNLYTASVVALHPDTGKLAWHYQEVPHDVWDFDAAFELILADVPWQGAVRKALIHPTKTGYVFVLDRTNGKFLKAWPFAKHINWVQGITEDGKLIGRREPELGKSVFVCPSVGGAKNWNQGAYSPNGHLLFLPVMELCNDLVAREEAAVEGKAFTGGNWVVKPPPGAQVEGYVAAYDVRTGEKKWSTPSPTLNLASLLATDGGLVFGGDPDGMFFALDAQSGKKLWSFATGGGHRGSSVTYMAGGRQFVATPSGWGSIAGGIVQALFPNAPRPRPGSALVVFALPEGTR